MIAISIEHLTKRFDGTLALDDVTLHIPAGEIFFLLGPSGCGKTTLLRTIAGFAPPDSGRVLFGEEDVTRLPPHRRETGMMFQSYALWPHMSVAGNVAFGLEERGVARREITRRVGEALASVRMEGLGERRIHQLSGGQQQRVALARALVIRPRCLLLDEPLSNLDTRLRLEMRSEIRRICREAKLTAIYVTHDQKEALSIADRMAILRSGRLLQVGAPSELYRRPESRFAAEFMGETNFIDGRVASLNEEEVTNETALGALVASRATRASSVGEPVTLSIRPECWRMSAQPAAQNAIFGKITEQFYLGETAEYTILPSGGAHRTLKVTELNPREATSSIGGPSISPSRPWM